MFTQRHKFNLRGFADKVKSAKDLNTNEKKNVAEMQKHLADAGPDHDPKHCKKCIILSDWFRVAMHRHDPDYKPVVRPPAPVKKAGRAVG